MHSFTLALSVSEARATTSVTPNRGLVATRLHLAGRRGPRDESLSGAGARTLKSDSAARPRAPSGAWPKAVARARERGPDRAWLGVRPSTTVLRSFFRPTGREERPAEEASRVARQARGRRRYGGRLGGVARARAVRADRRRGPLRPRARRAVRSRAHGARARPWDGRRPLPRQRVHELRRQDPG